MRHTLLTVFVMSVAVSLGCAITDYPIITDTRGDYTGIIRTGHKAYIVPSFTVATIWDDGSDEIFTLVYQNAYGDQMLNQFNNFDPSAAVTFLDQTYCDWRYEGCEFERAWNPRQDNIDNIFDYSLFIECSGARSECILLSVSSRIGECGDAGFRADEQDLAAVFSDLAPTSFQGRRAYAGSLSAENTTITLHASNGVSTSVPIYGATPFIVNDRLQTAIPVGPQVKHTLQWLIQYIDQTGPRTTATIQHGAVEASFEIKLVRDNLISNLDRF